jgi:hypothetical protein
MASVAVTGMQERPFGFFRKSEKLSIIGGKT